VSKKTRRKNRRALAANAARHADLNSGNVVLETSYPLVAILDDVDDAHDVERFVGSTTLTQVVTPTAELDTLLFSKRMEFKGVLKRSSNDPKTKNMLIRLAIDAVKGDPEKSPDPPQLATFLFLLIPIRQREHLLGDLEEEFRTRLVPEYGPRWARLYFYWHVVIELTTALTKAATGAVLGFAISRLTK